MLALLMGILILLASWTQTVETFGIVVRADGCTVNPCAPIGAKP